MLVFQSYLQSNNITVLYGVSTFADLVQIFYNWSYLVINSWSNWQHTYVFCVICPRGRHRYFWQTCALWGLSYQPTYHPPTMYFPQNQQENSEWKPCSRKDHVLQFPWAVVKDPSEGDFWFTWHRPLKYTQSGIN